MFQHYSFDLWLTLIKSDPLFKKERVRLFHEKFNHSQKKIGEIERIFRQVDIISNAINEKTGKNIDSDEMYLMVIGMVNEDIAVLQDVDIEELQREVESLLFDHMPVIYSSETIPALATLKSAGKTLNILSNTGFIKGKTLRKVLTERGFSDLFDFQLYSDEAGMSKPNLAFFQLMLQTARGNNKFLLPEHVIHVGDNIRADIQGAKKAGIGSMLINSNDISIYQLATLCQPSPSIK